MLQLAGIVEVITGSMFCGKTEELIRRLRRASIAKQKVQVFKPVIDDRYAFFKVKSHSGMDYEAVPVNSSAELLEKLDPEANVLRVIVAGFDTDFRGEPFGPMPIIIAQAEEVDKLHAICMECGEPATRTQRLVNGKPAHYNDPVVIVGAAEMYEARCRKHHIVPRD